MPKEASISARGRSERLALQFDAALRLLQDRQFVRAAEAFDAILREAPGFPGAAINQGVALRLAGRPVDAERALKAPLANQPGSADLQNNLGLVIADQQRHAEALGFFNCAIALNPTFAEAHSNRGVALQALGRYDEALSAFATAIEIAPSYAQAYSNRANALRATGRSADALASLEQAINLQPDLASAWSNRGVLLQDFARTEEAIRSFDRALSLNMHFADAYWNKSLSVLQSGNMQDGWLLYEWRKRKPGPLGIRDLSAPEWTGAENIAGRTVFLHWEQGLGDTINFCRYANLLMKLGARVYLSVQEPLRELLLSLNPAVRVIGPQEQPRVIDYHLPLLSLPLAFKTRLDNIPDADGYLLPSIENLEKWHFLLGEKRRLRIGLAWSGSALHSNDRNRSLSLSQLMPLLDIEADFICLQKDIKNSDLDFINSMSILEYTSSIDSFSDTAALVCLVDLVVCVDTSIAHLAGALGRPVWVLLPFNADWRWMMGTERTPWYSSMRLFRQDASKDWAPVIAGVRARLRCLDGPLKSEQSPTKSGLSASSWLQLARRARSRYFLPYAAQAIEAAVHCSPDRSSLLLERALLAIRQARWHDALIDLDAVLALRPDMAIARRERATALLGLNRTADALALLEAEAVRSPDDAEIWFLRGNALHQLGRTAEALASFDKTIALAPGHAEALTNRGAVLRILGNPELALSAHEAAVALKPGFAAAHSNLGLAHQDLGDPYQAIISYDNALSLNPSFADALFNRGNALAEIGQPNLALRDYDAILSNRPDYPGLAWNRALALLKAGRTAEGLSAYEARFKEAGWSGRLDIAAPRWDGSQDIAGKTLLVLAEQGMGDMIQCSRYIPYLIGLGAEVYLAVPEALHGILRHLNPALRLVQPLETPVTDFHIPIMSLPLACGESLDAPAPPYLTAPSEEIGRWRRWLGPRRRPRIGLCWAGGTRHKKNHARSLQLISLAPLFALDADFISLQKEIPEQDKAALSSLSLRQPVINHFEDTAALITLMDLVITVDTSVAHLAGAMGARTWLLLPLDADWRWMVMRDDTPWYPSIRLLRQTVAGDWHGVLARLRQDLMLLLRGPIAVAPPPHARHFIILQATYNDSDATRSLLVLVRHLRRRGDCVQLQRRPGDHDDRWRPDFLATGATEIADRFTGSSETIVIGVTRAGGPALRSFVGRAHTIWWPHEAGIGADWLASHWPTATADIANFSAVILQHAGQQAFYDTILKDTASWRVHLIPPPVEIPPSSASTQRDDAVHIVSICTASFTKHHTDLVAAVSLLDSPRVRCTIIGHHHAIDDGTRAIITALPDRFSLLGANGEALVSSLLRTATIYAHLSDDEVFSTAPMKAAALGVPVVIADFLAYHGLWEDKRDCLIYAPGDVPALTAALTALIHNPALRNSLSEAARARAQALNRDSFTARFDVVLATLRDVLIRPPLIDLQKV